MTVDALMSNIETYILIPIFSLLFALGLLYFLWGMATFVWKADSDAGRATGIQHMLWGLIGMFIMIAGYGIVNLLKATFGI